MGSDLFLVLSLTYYDLGLVPASLGSVSPFRGQRGGPKSMCLKLHRLLKCGFDSDNLG